jgi:hypothetical protein
MVGDGELYRRCEELGSKVCSFCNIVLRMSNQRYSHQYDAGEWKHLGQVSAFLAYGELFGDADPDTVDWRSRELLMHASRILQKLTIGSKSDIYDSIIRVRLRRDGSFNDELRWAAWNQAHPSEVTDDSKAVTVPVDSYQRYFEFQSSLFKTELKDEVASELMRLLRPQEAVWLIRRYRDGVPTVALARELMDKEPRYQTEDGFTRACRYVDVVIHRAKKKARKLLPPVWGEFASEVA